MNKMKIYQKADMYIRLLSLFFNSKQLLSPLCVYNTNYKKISVRAISIKRLNLLYLRKQLNNTR